MADWLALHGLTAQHCRTILTWDLPPAATRPADPVWPMAPRAMWTLIADCLRAGLPTDAIAETAATTRLHLHTDPGPRAFTLHDDGAGRPVVSARLTGKLSDLLTLAHEFGHAVQITASGPQMPPVLREVCAGLAERLVMTELARRGTDEAALLPALFAARGQRTQGQTRRDLAALLDAPATPYAYRWNYPLARRIVARLAPDMASDRIWPVFQGRRTLAEIVADLTDK